MTVNISAARLFNEAFTRGDFTGWPDFVRMDDGTWMSQLYLSVSRRRLVYSVIARTQDPKGRMFQFVLCIDQAVPELGSLHNKVGVMNVALANDEERTPRLAIGVDYGEYIVLDAVEQPAIRSLAEARASYKEEAVGQPERDPSEDGYEDCSDDDTVESEAQPPGFRDRFSSRSSRKRERKELERKARESMPPRDRTGFGRGR